LKTILLTGATGLLGPYLKQVLSSYGQVETVARSGAMHCCDLTNATEVQILMKTLMPDVIVVAAGLTDVDLCERNPQLARAVNVQTTQNLVDNVSKDTAFVYISTDQVYADNLHLHTEVEEAPINVYGQSKLDAEKKVLHLENNLVLRTNIFGPTQTAGRASLSDIIIDRMTSGAEMTFFNDVYFSPLHMHTLSLILVDCLSKKISGTYNLGCREGMTKGEFAKLICNHFLISTDTAKDGPSSVMLDRAPRPLDMRMDVSKLEQALGRQMPTLKQEIKLL
jgi:dTDP-4-dehydrorhamnose reductase